METQTSSALPTTSNEMPKSQTTILDLNDDCLKYLFAMLDFADLVNMAQIHERFREAACYVFSRDRGKHLIKMAETSIIDYQDETVEIHEMAVAREFF